MTIDGLISELHRRRDLHGGQVPVVVTWEGITREIDPENIYLAKPDLWGFSVALLIDADRNFYKEDFQHPSDKQPTPDS